MSSRFLTAFLITLAVIALDWTSKLYAQEKLFVIFNDKEAPLWPIPILLALTAFLLIVNKDPLVAVTLGILAGGWLANFIDRFFFGPVTDFIPLPQQFGSDYYGNVADIAILLSLLLCVVLVIRSVWSDLIKR